MKLKKEEKECLKLLAEAWNVFIGSSNLYSKDDVDMFRQAIHQCQLIIALELARRCGIDIWSEG